MQDLNIALIQTNPIWHDPQGNLDLFGSLIEPLPKVDLIVLPEMFTTGFTMETKQMSEKPGGPTFEWMVKTSKETGAVIVGSYILNDHGKYFNHLVWARPNGQTGSYNKRHLFRMANEDQYFSSGYQKTVFEIKGWQILPLICYDLRFPVWSRNSHEGDELSYDLLLYVANWPQPRIEAWNALLKARAIENLCFTVGVNRIGNDNNGIRYNGHSGIYGPKGESVLFMEEKNMAGICTIESDYLKNYRSHFPAFLDADSFEIKDS